MVQDIVSVLDELGLEKAHYMGYSSGGRLGFGVAKFAPERCRSLIIGGTHPYPDEDPDASAAWTNGQIQMLKHQSTSEFVAGIESFLASVNLPPLSPHIRTRMLTHDTRALIAWLRQAINAPTFEDIVSTISFPCLNAANEIRGASFVGIPDGGHLEGGT